MAFTFGGFVIGFGAGGTDDQTLDFDPTTNVLEIEDGNNIDLSSLDEGPFFDMWGNEILG